MYGRPSMKSVCINRYKISEMARVPQPREHGLINIVVVTLTLPILILILIAALDIMRLPIQKQALYASLSSAYDHLIDTRSVSGLMQKIYGRNWCCDGVGCASNITCDGEGAVNWTDGDPGTNPLEYAAAAFLDNMTDATSSSLFRSASTDDLSIKIGVYRLNVKATPDDASDASYIESVTVIDELEAGGYGYAEKVDLEQYVIDTFQTPGSVGVGTEFGYWTANDPNATDITVVAFWGAVRVPHNINFPSWLKMGIAPLEEGEPGEYKPDESVISASIIRALPREIYLVRDEYSSTTTSTSTTSITTTTTTSASSSEGTGAG
jgi:hypothetical protein